MWVYTCHIECNEFRMIGKPRCSFKVSRCGWCKAYNFICSWTSAGSGIRICRCFSTVFAFPTLSRTKLQRVGSLSVIMIMKSRQALMISYLNPLLPSPLSLLLKRHAVNMALLHLCQCEQSSRPGIPWKQDMSIQKYATQMFKIYLIAQHLNMGSQLS